MKLATAKVKSLAGERGESLSRLLARAGVSRTAFYSLARRSSILPKTVRALADALGVSELEILDTTPQAEGADVRHRLREAKRIVGSRPGASFENIWHTLYLLDLDPVERLNRSLIRGRATALHR